MNKKGNFMLGATFALLFFVLGVIAMPYVITSVDFLRLNLDCTSSTISSGTMILCLMSDVVIPYLILIFSSIALGYLVGKK